MTWDRPAPGSIADERRREREERGRAVAHAHLAYCRAVLAGQDVELPAVDGDRFDPEEEF